MLFLAGSFILGFDLKDAVGVDIKRHLDLRQPARGRQYPVQNETSQRLVVRGHFPFTLDDVYFYGCLIIGGRGKYLSLTRRDTRDRKSTRLDSSQMSISDAVL